MLRMYDAMDGNVDVTFPFCMISLSVDGMDEKVGVMEFK